MYSNEQDSNKLVLNLNKYISQSVITQSIFQEWQQLCCSSPDLNDNGVINLSYQEHWSVFCNNLVVMHLLALSWLTNAVHIFQGSVLLIVYVSPVIWYFIYSSMQYDRYYLLHTRAKIVYNFVFDCTIICCIWKNIF